MEISWLILLRLCYGQQQYSLGNGQLSWVWDLCLVLIHLLKNHAAQPGWWSWWRRLCEVVKCDCVTGQVWGMRSDVVFWRSPLEGFQNPWGPALHAWVFRTAYDSRDNLALLSCVPADALKSTVSFNRDRHWSLREHMQKNTSKLTNQWVCIIGQNKSVIFHDQVPSQNDLESAFEISCSSHHVANTKSISFCSFALDKKISHCQMNEEHKKTAL